MAELNAHFKSLILIISSIMLIRLAVHYWRWKLGAGVIYRVLQFSVVNTQFSINLILSVKKTFFYNKNRWNSENCSLLNSHFQFSSLLNSFSFVSCFNLSLSLFLLLSSTLWRWCMFSTILEYSCWWLITCPGRIVGDTCAQKKQSEAETPVCRKWRRGPLYRSKRASLG